MFIDPSGFDPETWQWLVSSAFVVAGLILIATGVLTPLGGALIGAGVSSMVSGYISEANGGSFMAGYISGAITGAICGITAGIGGNFIYAGLEASNIVLSSIFIGIGISFTGGFSGKFLGDYIYSNLNGSYFDINRTIGESFVAGSINVFAGIMSAYSNSYLDLASQAGQRIIGVGASSIAFSTEGVGHLAMYGYQCVIDCYNYYLKSKRRIVEPWILL
jgi:hypothetical protein